MYMMLAFGLILALYVWGRTILPTKLGWGWKGVSLLGIVLVGWKFHMLHWIGGGMFFGPNLPSWVLLVGAWLYALLFIYCFMLVGVDILRAVVQGVFFLTKKKKPSWLSQKNAVHGGLFALCIVLTSLGLWAGTSVPEVREVSLPVAKLSPQAEGLRIAVLADIHVDRLTRGERIREIVQRVNAAAPDMVVIAGDLVDGSVEDLGEEIAPLAGLQAKYGVYAVPGNHEYYSGYEAWERFFFEKGIRFLNNEHIACEGLSLVVAGVTDPASSHQGMPGPQPEVALAGTMPDSVKIVLAHQPKIAKSIAQAGADIQIAGHTHGGMIQGMNFMVGRMNEGYASGLYSVGKMKLFVSNGSGIWNGFPIRLGVPSEIAILRLTAEEE